MSLRVPLLLSLLPLLALSACATPESRIRTALVGSGVSPPVAGCMAERMADRLSMSQLRKLSSLAKLKGDALETMSVGELLKHVRALGDPEIVQVTASSGLRCALAA